MSREVKEIFELWRTNTYHNYQEIEDAMNQEDGAKFFDNDYIQIEYHNQIGYEKSKMLIDIFEENKVFYQYFLKKYNKIVIKNNYQANQNEIVINNYPTDISESILLEKIIPNFSFLSPIRSLIIKKEELLEKEDVLSFLKSKILEDKVSKKEIDFFKYLELMKGMFVNHDSIYIKAIVDLAFEYSNMQILDNYMNNKNIENIQNRIFWELARRYNIALFNQSLEHQNKLFNKKNDIFLANNTSALYQLFCEKVPLIEKKYVNQISNKTTTISQEEILKLVIEILHEIDETDTLLREFTENIENKRIRIWNPNSTEQSKKMQEQYFKKFDIYKPQCVTFVKENTISDVIMNVPLSYTIEDVLTIIHEFFHFHINLSSLVPEKNPALGEFLSIYYEMYVCQFLAKKGYTKEETTNLFNFRITDTISNYIHSAPIIFWFNKYKEKGKIRYQDILDIIEPIVENTRKYFIESGLSEQEIAKRMEQYGYYSDINQTIHQLIFTINNLLLVQDESVFGRYPYILGTILSYEVMEKKVDFKYILNLSSQINQIEDPYEILEKLGIDVEKYNFQNTSCLSNENNHLKH